MKSAKTGKGTELPLISLKGKDYLQVAHRLVWLNDDVVRFNIDTKFLVLTETETVCQATVVVCNEIGEALRVVTATKREDKSHFQDHTEKAETGAIGRALALLGFGTQFCVADLDEGERLADAPTTTRRSVPPKASKAKVEDF